MPIKIARHVNNITLNPLEFIIDKPDGDILYFATKENAKEFLRTNGITDEDDLEDCFLYIDTETELPV